MKSGSGLKKFLLFQLPYIFYISFLLYWFYNTFADKMTINYIAIGGAMVVFVQFVFQNKIAGASLGVTGTVFSLFAISYLLTEYNNSVIGNFLFAIGLIMTFFSLLMGLVLIITNLKNINHVRKNRPKN